MSFYCFQNGELLSAPNRVTGPTFDLKREEKDNFIYPVEGWYWFDTEEEAYIFFNLNIPTKESIINDD